MSKSLPPLTWFRAFEASARHLSFTAAAQELNLTQSAISQQVRSLELRFKVLLFQRLPRGLALTDDGRRLLPEVNEALSSLAAVTRRYEQTDSAAQLTVATSVSFIQWIITPAIHRFQQMIEDHQLRLISTVWPDDFKAAHADIEIRFGSEALVGDGAQRLLPDNLIVVASPALSVEPDNLSQLPLIESVGTTDGWEQWAQAVSYSGDLKPTLFVDYHGAALDLAVAGAGIALTSSLLAASCLSAGTLTQVRSESLHSEDGYYLAVRPNASNAALGFTRCLENELGTSLTGSKKSKR